jgi:hypothetical protein
MQRPRNVRFIRGQVLQQRKAGLRTPGQLAIPTGLLPLKTGPRHTAGRHQLRLTGQPAARPATAGPAVLPATAGPAAHRAVDGQAAPQVTTGRAAAAPPATEAQAVPQAPTVQAAAPVHHHHHHRVVLPALQEDLRPPAVEEGN